MRGPLPLDNPILADGREDGLTDHWSHLRRTTPMGYVQSPPGRARYSTVLLLVHDHKIWVSSKLFQGFCERNDTAVSSMLSRSRIVVHFVSGGGKHPGVGGGFGGVCWSTKIGQGWFGSVQHQTLGLAISEMNFLQGEDGEGEME